MQDPEDAEETVTEENAEEHQEMQGPKGKPMSGWIPLGIMLIWCIVFLVWGMSKTVKADPLERPGIEEVLGSAMLRTRVKGIESMPAEERDVGDMTNMFSMLGMLNVIDGKSSGLYLAGWIIFLLISIIILKAWVKQHCDSVSNVDPHIGEACLGPDTQK